MNTVNHPEFVKSLLEGTRAALDFDGDVVALAARAHAGDEQAVDELARAHWTLAALVGIRLRPEWLQPPDAAQEAVLVLIQLIRSGSTTIAQELGAEVAEAFGRLKNKGDER